MDWYYENNGQQVGPLTEEEFQESVRKGHVAPGTLVWNESMSGWQPYATPAAGAAVVKDRITAHCSQCGRQFPEDEMLRYQQMWICVQCKPLFFQHLKEAGAVPGTYIYGGFWIRVLAKLVDGLIFLVVYIAAGLAMRIPFTAASDHPPLAGLSIVAFWLLQMAVSVGYSIYFVGKYGATPGKMATGLRIISADGEPVGYAKATARFFSEMISGIICYAGYIMAAFDEEKRALHDRICNTRVVRK